MAPYWLDLSSEMAGNMSNPAQVGKYEWQAALAEARVVKAELRSLLRRALENYDIKLLAQASLKLGELDDLIVRLEEIGRQTK